MNGRIDFGLFEESPGASLSRSFRRLALVSSFLLLSGCLGASDAADQGHAGEILDESYRGFYERSKDKLEQTLPPLSGDGVSIAGCDDLFSYLENGGSTVTLAEQAAWRDYGGCLAVGLLDRLQPFEEARFPSDAIGADLYSHLDLRTLRSSFGPKQDDEHFTLKALTASPSETTERRIVIEEPNWYYELKTLAHGDFNRDQQEDLLVLFVDNAKGGTYQSSQLLLLTRDEASGPIRSIPLSNAFSDNDARE